MTRHIDDVVTVPIQTTKFSTGAAFDADSTPVVKVYEETTTAPILTPTVAVQDNGNTVGFYSTQFTASAANGFEVGKTYIVRVEATVDAVTAAAIIDRFVIRAAVLTADNFWDEAISTEATGYPTTLRDALITTLGRLVNYQTKNHDTGAVTVYKRDSTTAMLTTTDTETDTISTAGKLA